MAKRQIKAKNRCNDREIKKKQWNKYEFICMK